MAALVRGVDVSSWQHPGGELIDWVAAKAAGVDFAIVKATQGTDYVSPYLRDDLAGARSAGILVGAYHFVVVGPTGEAQAAWCASHLAGEVLELGAWIDWEIGPIPDWEVTTLYNGLVTTLDETRPGTGLYADLDWHARITGQNLKVARLWLADPSADTAPPGTLIWQQGSKTVPGIPGLTDSDELLSTRGVNLRPPAKAAPVPEPAPAPVPLVDRVEHAAEVAVARADEALKLAEADKAAETAPAAPTAPEGPLAVPRTSP